MARTGWVDVDLDGLAKLVKHRGKVVVLNELTQNALDELTTRIDVEVAKIPRQSLVSVTVTDDNPQGFKDITHAHTMFADSHKKTDATKRGRFNLGEKLVLAMCKSAFVNTTTGTVRFLENGEREWDPDTKTEAGSRFHGLMVMTTAEMEEALREFRKLIPPPNVEVYINGERLEPREPVASFEVTLATVRADDEGNLTPTRRKTTVRLFEPRAGEEPFIYEMGIPVVQFGDHFHVDVDQKVPVNLERDNVPPSYLKQIRAEVLNHAHDHLDTASAGELWVTDGLGHKDVTPETLNAVLDARYGENRAIFDPSDTEANDRLRAKGFNLVHGSSLPKDVWKRVKETGAMQAAGKLDPTHSRNLVDGDLWPEDEFNDGMRGVERLTKELGKALLGRDLTVLFLDAPHATAIADYEQAKGTLRFNASHPSLAEHPNTSAEWFHGSLHAILDLIIHEMAHEYEANHYSTSYNDALSDVGARMVVFALMHPEVFKGPVEGAPPWLRSYGPKARKG